MFAQYIAIFIFLPTFVFSLRSYTIEFKSYQQNYNKDFYEYQDYKLIKFNHHAVLNGSSILKRDIDSVDLRVVATAASNDRNKKFKLFDLQGEVCKFIDSSDKRPLNMVYYLQAAVKKHGHILPERCPYKKGEDYNLLNLYLNSEDFPPYIPPMMLNVFVVLKHKNVEFFNGNVSVEIAAKKKV